MLLICSLFVLFSNKPVSQSCAVAKSEQFWLATEQSNFAYRRLAASKVGPKFSFCTHVNALWPLDQFSILCQIWLSSGPPEFLTFSYCPWLWNWLNKKNEQAGQTCYGAYVTRYLNCSLKEISQCLSLEHSPLVKLETEIMWCSAHVGCVTLKVEWARSKSGWGIGLALGVLFSKHVKLLYTREFFSFTIWGCLKTMSFDHEIHMNVLCTQWLIKCVGIFTFRIK